MKKAFLLLIAAVTLVGTIGFNFSAKGSNLIEASVYSDLFTDAKAGTHISAGLYTDGADLQELPCTATEDPSKVSCLFPEEAAGQQVTVALTKNGIQYVHFVDIPAR
jgi:hypothetical protein